MSRGSPDYGIPDYSFFAVETPVSDIIAERQGFSRLDNRGRVIYFDDFREGIFRWHLEQDGTGDFPKHLYTEGYSVGFYGAMMFRGNASGDVSGMFTRLNLPVSKKLGIEVSVYIINGFSRVNILLEHLYTGINGFRAELSILKQTGEFVIVNSGGDQHIFTPLDVTSLYNQWISVKIVADYSTGKYERLMIGNTQYDISSLSMTSGLTGFAGNTQAELYTSVSDATYKQPVYIGYVIISGDEP
jgi:hypothetical protein